MPKKTVEKSNTLYLACYAVETEVKITRKTSESKYIVEQSPYVDQNGSFESPVGVMSHVLRYESPLAVVQFEQQFAKIAKYIAILNDILCELNFELNDQDRWCAITNNRFATIFFCLLEMNNIPGTARGKVLSKEYTIADFTRKYFSDHPSASFTRYQPPQTGRSGVEPPFSSTVYSIPSL